MSEQNALLAGPAEIRLGYLLLNKLTPRMPPPSGFDLPAVCGGNNAGTPNVSRSWNVNIKDRYVEKAVVYYNAAVKFFEDNPDVIPAPLVRFRP
jgi:hypothetical protein